MGTVPAGLTGVAGPIGGGADLVVFAETTAHLTTAAVLPSFTRLVAEGTLVPGVTQAPPAGRVTAAVCEVTVTSPVTAGSPPARLAVAHAGSLVTLRQVAVARVDAFHPPEALVALTVAPQLVAGGAHGSPDDALARFGAGRHPPALLARAVPVDRMAVAVPGAFATELALRTPPVAVAGALARGGVTATVWVAVTHLATVRTPEVGRTAW